MGDKNDEQQQTTYRGEVMPVKPLPDIKHLEDHFEQALFHLSAIYRHMEGRSGPVAVTISGHASRMHTHLRSLLLHGLPHVYEEEKVIFRRPG